MSDKLQAQARSTPALATSLSPAPAGLLQRKCACGNSPGVDGECVGCRQNRMTLQRRAMNQAGPALAPPVVHDVLRSPGQPMDAATRAFMEPRFGHDFSQVRIHADARAAASAQAVSAMAYTVGRDIVFGAGPYTPSSTEGRRLMAHELAHVVQQDGLSGLSYQARLLDDSDNDRYEQEASQAASAVADSHSIKVSMRPAMPTIQRQAVPTGITLKEAKPFGHSDLKSDDLKEKSRTCAGSTTLMQVTPAGDYREREKKGDCVKEFLTEVANTCPAQELFKFCTKSQCLQIGFNGTAGDAPTGKMVTDGPDTFIDRHVKRHTQSLLEASGKDKCSVVCHQRYKYRTEPDKKLHDLGSFYLIYNLRADKYTPPGSKNALHITTGEMQKVTAGLEAPSAEKFAKDIAPGLTKSGVLTVAPPVPKTLPVPKESKEEPPAKE